MMDWVNSDLSILPTEVLKSLKMEFGIELERRRRAQKISQKRYEVEKVRPYRDIDFGDLERVNGSAWYAIKEDIRSTPMSNVKYLKALLAQDWSPLFSGCFDETPKYYVYAHIMPGVPVFSASEQFGGSWGGMPFYIGKGCGGRAYDLKRNQAHGKYIARALAEGLDVQGIVKIISDGLTEQAAYELEAKYIYFFGTVYEEKPGVLVNLDTSVRPKFIGNMTRYGKEKSGNEHWAKQWYKDHKHLLETAP